MKFKDPIKSCLDPRSGPIYILIEDTDKTQPFRLIVKNGKTTFEGSSTQIDWVVLAKVCSDAMEIEELQREQMIVAKRGH